MKKTSPQRTSPTAAVVYCRVSTKEQTQNLSLPTQQTRCVDYCTRQGWPVERVFRDEGESAKPQNRPEFQRMLAYCKANRHRIGFVVVHDLSRFSRAVDDQAVVISSLNAMEIRLRSVMENLDETAAGKLICNMTAVFNQFDNDRKAERTRLGMQKSAAMGRFPFKAPLGYLNARAPNGGNLVPDPVRAPLISKAFELYASGAYSRREVLRKVTALGLTTQKGRAITAQSFESLLRREIYAGWVCIPSWGVRERGSFTPLISQSTFDAVRDLLLGRRLSVSAHDRNNPDFPLRVFVRCQRCSEPLTGSWSKGRTQRYPYYRCRNGKCKGVNIRKEALERDFVGLLEGLKPQQKYMQLFRGIVRHLWNQKQADANALVAVARQELGELTKRKNRLVDALLMEKIDQDTYEEQLARHATETSSAEQRLRDAELESFDIEQVLEFAEKLVSNPAQLWLRASLEQKQRLQQVLFPSGLSFSKDGFGTPPTDSLFSVFGALGGAETSLASPAGFEPALSP